jgi:tRNA dimethylallyltransferase
MPSIGRATSVEQSTTGQRDPLLVALLGPTASGKTALALSLAEKFGGEIVNCDSVAIYREFEIGTAKPPLQERARAPHHMIDALAPTQASTAGDFTRMARQKLAEIKLRGRLPIVVGGTGLYLRALLEGLFAGPPRSEDLRERLRGMEAKKRAGYLHRLLARLDPESAGNIHANDTAKLIRAIEVCLTARRRMSDLWRHGRDPLAGFRILRVGLDPDREALYARINARAQRMFDAGLLEETRTLREKYGRQARALASLGYRQALQCLGGELDRASALAAAQQAHRNYAKRQMTWFRREPEVHWFHDFGDQPELQQCVFALVKELL